MQIQILFTLLFPLLSAPLARAVIGRVEPRRATWLLTGSALLLAGISCGALGLLVLAALVRVPWLARLGHLSLTSVASRSLRGYPSTWTAWVAGVLLGAALLAAAAFVVRRTHALSAARRHARELPGRGQLVVTGDEAADAYALPGRPGRIVVSAGMLDALDERARAALVAHERAHLSARHHWFTGAARCAAAANPLVRPLADAVEYTVERWADEAAATAVGDRRLVAQAIAAAAVAAKRTRSRRSLAAALGAVPVAMLGVFGSRGRVRDRLKEAGPVPRRVAALLAPAPRRGLPSIAVCLVLLAAAVLLAGNAADHLQDLLKLAHVDPD